MTGMEGSLFIWETYPKNTQFQLQASAHCQLPCRSNTSLFDPLITQNIYDKRMHTLYLRRFCILDYYVALVALPGI